MLPANGPLFISVPRRVGLWFIALLLAVGLFSLLFCFMPNIAPPSLETLSGVFVATLTFALPVGCLCLPIVIGLKDAEERRIWIILCCGILIGPLSMAVWGLVLQWHGEDSHTVWHGDPLLGIGGIAGIVFAAIVGSFTALFYVIALRVIHRRFSKLVDLTSAPHQARKFEDEEFKAKLEMTKAFCDTAKSYVQISSVGVALPLLFRQAMLGDTDAKKGLLGSLPWTLKTSWLFFLFSIAFGLLYQWLSMRRLWDQYHAGNWTPDKDQEPGYRTTKGVLRTDKLNLSWVWLGMTGSLFVGAVFFVVYSALFIARGR